MAEPYQIPVARLWSDDGSVVGAGFLAPRGVVVTCAHVVNDALGRDQLHGDEPRGEIRIDRPWAVGKTEFRGSIVAWRPPVPPDRRRPDPCVDIAVLQLDPEPPAAVTLQPQAPARVQEDTRFSVMGFPAGRDAGAGARGTVRATDADGWHLVEADRDWGGTMEPGFSGAPAIANDRRLLGMIDLTNVDERRGVLIPVEALMRAWPPLAEPYRGLQAFREEDAAYFFGRDALKARLWSSFERNPVTLLTGPSGSGKSSLLNAGFLPRLRSQGGWRLMRLRPGDRPVQRLGETLAKALKPQADALELVDRSVELTSKLTSDPDRLSAYARTLQDADGTRLCLIVDQFEETFTLAEPARPDEHTAFLALLTGLATQRAPAAAKVVLALRSDFQTMLQSASAAAGLIAALDGDPTVLLRPLTPPELEQVIRGPLAADRLDVALDDGLLAQLLHDITRNADALPLLEFALTELWARIGIDRAGRSLSYAAYDAMGGISGALTQHADAALTELQLGEAETKRLFVELVRVGGSAEQDTRRPRRKTELDAIDPALWPVAQLLAGRRLVVLTAGPAVDLIHEAILRQWPRLAGWIEAERNFLRWRQRLDERRREWDQAGQQVDDLLAGNALDEAARWLAASAAALDEPQSTYINASISAQAAGHCRQEADALWDRLELTWTPRRIPEHEQRALIDLARAAPDVRHEFLINAVTSESRARRFGRQPQVAIRAAVGLDLALVAQAHDKLVGLWRRGLPLSNEQLRASISIGAALDDETSRVLPLLLVEQVIRAIPGTTDPDQLQAFGKVVRAFADRVDAETARTLVEQVVRAIPGTVIPGRLQAYGEVIRAFADRVDAETIDAAARTVVEQVVRAIPGVVNPSLLQAYGEVVRAFADRVDAETARTVVEQMVRAIPRTVISSQLQVYGEVLRALADRVDGEAIDAVARTVVEQMVRTLYSSFSATTFDALLDAVLSIRLKLDPAASAHLLAELLKHPLAGRTAPTQKLIGALGDTLGLGLPPATGLWQFLAAVAAADPSLPLAAPYAGPEEILAGLRRRLEV